MLAQCSPHCQWFTTFLSAAVVSFLPIAHASEVIEPRTSAQTRGLQDECVALSNAMALNKLGISVTGRNLAQRRIANRLGREFEAAHETFPEAVIDKIVARVLLNRSSKVTSDVLRDLTEGGALVLSLSTKRLLGDRSGKAKPDHAVHIRGIIRKRGVDYMVVENCWGPGWERRGIGHVPVSTLRELPYVYGLFLQRRDAAGISATTSKMLAARPFRILYASGRSYPQPKSTAAPPRSIRIKTDEVNRFMNDLLGSR